MKANQPNIVATRYGGMIPIVQEMIRRGIPEMIDSSMNEVLPRAKQSKYKYSDMFMTWIAAAMCGAKRVDNVTALMSDLEVIAGLNVPSHDTIGRLMKKIAAPIVKEERVSPRMVTMNEWDNNIPLNKLLIQLSKACGALNERDEYILDVDCTFIHTQSVNASNNYKDKRQGFNPMICLIGSLPVFISMRNGNSAADFKQKECVEQCLELLKAEGIKVVTVRTDGAGYKSNYTKMIHDRGIKFLTASPVNWTFKKMFSQFDRAEWKDVTIETATEFRNCQIAEIKNNMYQLDEKWRVIALKVPVDSTKDLRDEDIQFRKEVDEKLLMLKNAGKLKSHQKRFSEADWGEVRGYKYKMIATNDFETPAEELIYLYNRRGDAERKFSFMKRDFGWKYPPFMRMNENTVFLIVSAIANNIFRGMAIHFNETIDDLELNARVRKFQEAFINTVAILIDGTWSFYNTKIDFEKIK